MLSPLNLSSKLRAKLFNCPFIPRGQYPLDIKFLKYHFSKFLEQEDDLAGDDRLSVQREMKKWEEEDYLLPPEYQRFYFATMESLYLQSQGRGSSSVGIDPHELDDCVAFGHDVYQQLRASEILSNFFLYDLLVVKKSA